MKAALNEYASVFGSEEPEREWTLSPYDTWHRNPYYGGPRGKHPEEDYE